jgi:hypothetical protein
VSNGLHSESSLQKCPQCNGQCKSPLPVLTSGPQDLARSLRYMRRRMKASISFNRDKAYAHGNRCVSFRRDSGDAGSWNASLKLISQLQALFHARYQSSMWAQRNSHFTWLVTSCGNGRCLMPFTNPISQFIKIVETQVHIRRLWFWASVTGFALVPSTKVPCGPRKQSFHVISG